MNGHNCLSNNGCTDPTDKCVAATWNTFDAKLVPVAENQTDADIKTVITYAHNKIKSTTELRVKYLIADYMFPLVKHLAQKPEHAHVYAYMGSLEHIKTITPHDIEKLVAQF